MKLPLVFGFGLVASSYVPAQQHRRLTRGPQWAPLRTEAEAEVVAGGTTGLRAGAGVAGTTAAKRTEMGVPHWKAGLLATLALLGGVAIGGGVCYFVVGRKKQAEEPPAGEDEAAQASARSGGDGAAEALMPAPEPEAEAVDYERLLRTLSQRVAQKVGPKLAKGQAVRGIIEERVLTMKEKAKAFFLNELNTTAGALLKAIEAEEAMLLLDWNNAVSMNLPPISVLLAGLLSPTLLSLRKLAHLLQLVVGLIPILVLCLWAVIKDYNTTCAIPTIYAWTYTQGGLALVLSVAHLMLYMRISNGKRELTAKAEAMGERLKAARTSAEAQEEMGLSEMREMFVCSSVLLQQALLVEESVRTSIWHKLSGAGSVMWMFVVVWNFWIVMGYTFMPGTIAFHPKAATVAAESYCGALVSVLAARIICVLHLVFLGVNVMTLATWISDMMTSSPAFGQGLLKQAAKIDQGILGVPVVQTLVKAFVLRGSMDMACSQLAVAGHERAQLERERQKAEDKLKAVDAQLQAVKAVEVSLKAKAGPDTSADLEASISQLEALGDTGMDDWKAKGAATIAELQGQAKALEEATTKDLEIMMQKITEAAEMIKGSDAYKSAMAKAQDAAELAQQRASEVHGQLKEQLTAENLKSVMDQAQQAAEVGMSRAQEVAGQLQDSEALKAAKEKMDQSLATASQGLASASADLSSRLAK